MTPLSVLIINISSGNSNASAKIEIAPGSAPIVGATFGSTDDEFLTFADFGSKVNIWNLNTGRSVEVKDPKSHMKGRGYTFRPRSGHLAVLCRSGPQDVLMLLAVNSREVIWSATLPTVDAQALTWSPDGMFLAVYESASLGSSAYVYTAAGDLYRNYSGDGTEDLQLGIKAMEWSPKSDMIAVSSHDRRVRLLNTRTFMPMMYLDHTVPIAVDTPASVWEEKVTGDTSRIYEAVAQQVTPPSVAASGTSDHILDTGISLMSYSADGKYLVTRCDEIPTTLWIWDLQKQTIASTLIHHSPVKQFQWHPSIPQLLVIQCAQEQPLVYLWEGPGIVPSAWAIDFSRAAGKIEISWLNSEANSLARPGLLLGDAKSSMVLWPRGQDLDPLQEVEEEEDSQHDRSEINEEGDDDDTLDSVFQVLTGRSSPFKHSRTDHEGGTVTLHSEMSEEISLVDDTFHGRGGNR